MRARTVSVWTRSTALLCSALLISSGAPLASQDQGQQQSVASAQDAPPIPNDQLDSLVAPIALYPDPLLSQLLVASTYPLEIIQLQQWLERNKNLKDKALTDAVEKQDWDPSIQAMAALPEVVKQLGDNIKWTSDLGNAFLAQQNDVMDAVQRMRQKAMSAGNLKSSEQLKVETEKVDNNTVIVIQPANPQIVYVPSYNPVVVYGPPIYPYPPIYYPPPGYYAAGMAISFGVGIAIGSAWRGGWGYGCGWGRSNNITINNNNTFIRNSNITNVNRPGTLPARGVNSTWQHNPQHRGGAPYSNRAMANKYGGTARGNSVATGNSNARQNLGQTGNRQQAGVGNRSSGANNFAANRAGAGSGGAGTNRPGGEASNLGANRGTGGASAAGSVANRGGNGTSTVGTNRGNSGGGERIGNRQVSPGSGARDNGAFGGASSGMGRGSAQASGRGAASMGASRGGNGGGRRR
jgi:hypothetical protein